MELFSDFETWSAGTKIYFALSVFGGLALVIQIMLLAFGFGDADVDADLNPDFDPSAMTDIDADTLPPGLDEQVVRTISAKKNGVSSMRRAASCSSTRSSRAISGVCARPETCR